MNELFINLKDLVYRFFTSEPGQNQEELPPSQQRLREYFKHHKFSDLLPYEAYDPITGLFHSEDSIGIVFEFSPTTGADDGIARIISGLFTQGLPDNVGIQCSIFGSPNILPRLTAWAGVRNGGKGEEVGVGQELQGRREKRNRNIFQELARRRVGYLMHGAYQSLLSDQPLLIRDFRLILSISLPKPLPSQEAIAIQRAVSLKASVVSMFRSAGMPGYAMTADDFVDLLDDILNPRFEMEPKRNPRKWDPHEQIKRQVVDRDTHYSVQRDSLRVNNMEVRSFSVQEYPTEWAVWLMGDLIGDYFENALRMPCPFMFTANIWVPDQVSAKNIGKMKQMRATQAVDSPIGRYAPVWKEKKAEWDFVNKKAAEGHTMCRVSHHVVLFARPGEGNLLESTVKSIYKQKGWKLVLDRWIQIQAFMESLPLMLDKAFARDMNTMGRMKTMLTWNAANLMPIIGEWKGGVSPVLQMIGRRGQLYWLDPFDNKEGNYNVAVSAKSGAGKSFFVQELSLAIRSLGGRAWIIDVGKSYEKICKFIQGEYIDFDPRNKININPFTHIHDWEEEGLPMLKPLIAQMASPSAPLTDIQLSYVEQALKEVWGKFGNESEITPVSEYLRNHDDARAKDIGQQLFPYTKSGMYGKYFSGPSTLNFTNSYIVLELGALSNKPDFQSVVLLNLMMQIAESMYSADPGARRQKKMCIIDEAWQLMGQGHAGKFIEKGYRVVRKHGGSFVTITQGINDYYKSETSRAALENSDWLYLLAQKAESIEQLKKADRLHMTEFMKQALMSVRTEQGKYSEIMAYGPHGWTVGRLLIDQFTEKLYSTTPDEFGYIEQLMGQGLTLADAVDRLANERGRR